MTREVGSLFDAPLTLLIRPFFRKRAEKSGKKKKTQRWPFLAQPPHGPGHHGLVAQQAPAFFFPYPYAPALRRFNGPCDAFGVPAR